MTIITQKHKLSLCKTWPYSSTKTSEMVVSKFGMWDEKGSHYNFPEFRKSRTSSLNFWSVVLKIVEHTVYLFHILLQKY